MSGWAKTSFTQRSQRKRKERQERNQRFLPCVPSVFFAVFARTPCALVNLPPELVSELDEEPIARAGEVLSEERSVGEVRAVSEECDRARARLVGCEQVEPEDSAVETRNRCTA